MANVMAPALVVHGGAGDLELTREEDAELACRAAIEVGLSVLGPGGSALDAVVAAVRSLEDAPVFNAGTGAALTRQGTIECDAAVMDGRTVSIGAVASMQNAANAIAIARAVLDDGEHVLLCGPGAWDFAREHGFAPAPPEQLITAKQRRKLELARAARNQSPAGGTVGACAIDRNGNVAAATSTGGTTFKRPGRVGDTPLCGCGTYADDQGGAASATGVGEAIVRVTMTRVCVDAMRGGASASAAAWHSVAELGRVTGGQAGIICCDRDGKLGAALSTDSLSFGAGRLAGGESRVAVGTRLDAGTDLERLLAG